MTNFANDDALVGYLGGKYNQAGPNGGPPAYMRAPSINGGGSGGGSGAVTGITVPQTATDLTESLGYTGTLATGAYSRANILALLGATEMISLSITCATGTLSFTQNGTISSLATGSIIDKPYAVGFSIDDFSFNVDAASTAYIETRGI